MIIQILGGGVGHSDSGWVTCGRPSGWSVGLGLIPSTYWALLFGEKEILKNLKGSE